MENFNNEFGLLGMGRQNLPGYVPEKAQLTLKPGQIDRNRQKIREKLGQIDDRAGRIQADREKTKKFWEWFDKQEMPDYDSKSGEYMDKVAEKILARSLFMNSEL